MPTFSFLIPSYNRPEFISKAVNSILEINDEDLEVIVSDDASPLVDKIRKELQIIEDKRFRLFYQDTNIGEAENRNFLFSKAEGKWSICLGDDDMMSPDCIPTLKNFISKKPNIDLFGFGFKMIDENDRVIYRKKSARYLKLNLQSKNFNPSLLTFNSFPYWYMHPATYCCKTSIMKTISAKPNIGIGDDFYFLFEFINRGYTLGIIDSYLFNYRRIQEVSDRQIPLSLNRLANCETRLLMIPELRSNLDLDPNIKQEIESNTFTNRFLYWAMSFENVKPRELEYLDDPLDLLKNYPYNYNISSRCYLRIVQRLFQLKENYQLNGLPGFYQILKTFFDRVLYRLIRQIK